MKQRDNIMQPTLSSLEAMRKFSETSVVIEGLAKHKDELGSPLCPCRHYEDKTIEVHEAYWNCPCVPMRERKECHCMLFLMPDNEFSGKDQKISLNTISSAIQ